MWYTCTNNIFREGLGKMSLKTIHLEKPFCKLSLKVFLFIKDVSKPSQILEKTSLINILLEKFF